MLLFTHTIIKKVNNYNRIIPKKRDSKLESLFLYEILKLQIKNRGTFRANQIL